MSAPLVPKKLSAASGFHAVRVNTVDSAKSAGQRCGAALGAGWTRLRKTTGALAPGTWMNPTDIRKT
jgi:hypothetical protein|tara:strand:+ start:2206 stop:2406 length:201 start_codon:yes stop_codon:yes gene_type:complete